MGIHVEVEESISVQRGLLEPYRVRRMPIPARGGAGQAQGVSSPAA